MQKVGSKHDWRRILTFSIDQNNTRWFTFELACDADLHLALDWFGTAYEAANKRRKSK